MAVSVPVHQGYVATAAGGRLGVGLELSKGAPVAAINHWLPTTALGIEFAFEQLRKSAYWGTRHMQNVFAVLKGKGAGNIPVGLFANASGIPLISAFGKELLVPGIPADVSTAIATDANGLTAVTIANTAGATYSLYANTYVDTGYTQECTPIVEISGNGAPGTVLYFKQLLPATRRSAGLSIQQPPQRRVTTRGPLDMQMWEAPSMQLEEVFGGQWGWQLNGCRNLKITVKGANQDVEITNNIVVTEIPRTLYPPGTPGAPLFTPFNPAAYATAELDESMTIRNSYLIVPNDNNLVFGSGAPYLTPPAAPGVSTAGVGGTVAAGTYGVQVALVNPQGETTPSATSTIPTTGGTSTITVTSPLAQGVGQAAATGYYVYMTQAGGVAYTRQQAPGSPTPIGTPFTLTAPPTTTGNAPAAINSAGTLVLVNAGIQQMSRLGEVEDVTLEWDNHGIDKHFMNESPVVDNYLGGTSGTLSYKYSTRAGRWDAWEDYIINEFAPPVPAIWRNARNIGSASAPIWRAVTFAIPRMKITNSVQSAPGNDTMNATVTGEIAPPPDLTEPIMAFILDANPTSLYALG